MNKSIKCLIFGLVIFSGGSVWSMSVERGLPINVAYNQSLLARAYATESKNPSLAMSIAVMALPLSCAKKFYKRLLESIYYVFNKGDLKLDDVSKDLELLRQIVFPFLNVNHRDFFMIDSRWPIELYNKPKEIAAKKERATQQEINNALAGLAVLRYVASEIDTATLRTELQSRLVLSS